MNYVDITEVTRVAEGLPASVPAPKEGGFSTGTAVASCSENHPATKSSPGRTTRPLASISEKRLAANRANAQKSTGPRTEAGKAAVAENACRTRFFARVHRMPARIAAHFRARAEEKTRCITDPARRALHYDWWMLDGHRVLHESRERALFNAGIEHANGDEAGATAWVLRQSGYIEALNRYAGWIQARLRKVELALAADPDLLESELVQMNPIEPKLQPEPPASEPSIDQPNPILAEQTHLAHPPHSATPRCQQPAQFPQHSLRHSPRPAPTPTSPASNPKILSLKNPAEAINAQDPAHEILAEQTHFPGHPPQQPEPLPQHSPRHCRRPAPTPTSSDRNPEKLPLENPAEQTHFADSFQLRANLPHHYPQRSWGPAAISTSPAPNPETNPPKKLAEIPVPEKLAEQTHFPSHPPQLEPLPQHSLRHRRRPAPTPTSSDPNPKSSSQGNLVEQTHCATSPTHLAPPPQKPTQRDPIAVGGTEAPRRINPAPPGYQCELVWLGRFRMSP
ncbi:MAG: hypothetical protein J0H49_23720 [Acidobacteria bacterium]|nr:hypothetical protein [Acidobacteriota bacterium]